MPPKLSSKRRIEKEIWKLGKDEQSRRQVTVVMSQLDKFAEQSKTVIRTKGVTVDISMQRLGSAVRQAREQKKITQTQVANVVGCRQAHISQIESGKTGVTLSRLQRIATAIGIDVRKLLEVVLTSDPAPTEQP